MHMQNSMVLLNYLLEKASVISCILCMVHKERYPVGSYAPEMWKSYSGMFNLQIHVRVVHVTVSLSIQELFSLFSTETTDGQVTFLVTPKFEGFHSLLSYSRILTEVRGCCTQTSVTHSVNSLRCLQSDGLTGDGLWLHFCLKF